MAQLQHAVSEFGELDKVVNKNDKTVNGMLRTIETRYGSKSGVLRQLNVLMQENDHLRKMASVNQYIGKHKTEGAKTLYSPKNFIERNKQRIKKTKEQVESDKYRVEEKKFAKLRANKLRKYINDCNEQ